jgi:hypothetical protein
VPSGTHRQDLTDDRNGDLFRPVRADVQSHGTVPGGADASRIVVYGLPGR